ncbi:2-hydroxyacid dehydrogenase [Marinibacterium profundimaris]|uniref:Hydroxyacid dehydrogenase n=1 Tax=Marinibacterium profundimaris TaxID=1679460 RepID=A0A225NHI6_9RHOB|nr:glyoxylate/hydroxypyruvate reductase A [Marinibacterium profundimaris]OWU73286.1 hydroxyacid dehydrogenase [Marinibacterium profundimaris]
MPCKILFSAENWSTWEAPLRTALDETGVAYDLVSDAAPETVDYVVYAPSSGLLDFTPFTSLKAVLSLWAGVEKIVGNETLQVPLARMVDPGLTEGMTEWVTGHVLRHHLGMDAHIRGLKGKWRKDVPPLARDRKVTILGLGALGADAARALKALNFDVAGWSRSPKTLDGIETFTGDDGLAEALRRAEILVLLLPLTPGTEDLLNADRLARLPKGAMIVNPGRGPLIDDTALLSALDSGQVGHATLDVFRVEPLPADHPFWLHPKVTVTPHIASETRPASASRVIAENVRRGEAGEPFVHLVDRSAGY